MRHHPLLREQNGSGVSSRVHVAPTSNPDFPSPGKRETTLWRNSCHRNYQVWYTLPIEEAYVTIEDDQRLALVTPQLVRRLYEA
jgi:hypothetical protein